MSRVDLDLRSGNTAGCAGLAGLRAVFVSDVHVGSYFGERELELVFERIRAESPDLLLLGGDLVHTRSREIEMWRRVLSGVSAPLGVYAVPGNHEYFFGLDIRHWSAVLEECGVVVLVNAGRRIVRDGASLWLCGVDDHEEGRADLDAALAGRRSGEACVLLSHHPDLFDLAARNDVDLTLSGHTHGGQISPFGWILLRHSRRGYHRGSFVQGGSRLVVGRGVGASILPLRVGARPEIVVVEFRDTTRGGDPRVS